MVDALNKAGLIAPTLVNAIITSLEEYWIDRMAVVWTTEDVHRQLNQRGLVMDDDRAVQILGQLLDDHDANHGINWNTIDFALPSADDEAVRKLTPAQKQAVENGHWYLLVPKGKRRFCEKRA